MSVYDTKPSAGTNTYDSEITARLTWAMAHRTWANSHFTWASSGANFNYDSEPSKLMGIGEMKIGSTFIIGTGLENKYIYDEKPS